MKSGLSFGLNNSSLTLKIGGRNLIGTANSSKRAYGFSNVTTNEVKTIFQEMTAGSAFGGADALWTAFQENVEDFINDPANGGSTQKQTPQIDRPDWDKVQEVLFLDQFTYPGIWCTSWPIDLSKYGIT